MSVKVLAAYTLSKEEKKKKAHYYYFLSNRGQISGDCYNANITLN